MKTLAEVLELVPAARKNRVAAAYENFKPELENFVAQVFATLERTSGKEQITSESEYIKPIAFGNSKPAIKLNCYMRYGTKRYGRFGHSYLCVSSIDVPEIMWRKGFFTALMYTLMCECQERKVILAVENPLEEFLQKFLMDIGFVIYHKDPFGLGTYYHLLKEGQISSEPFYNIEAYRNES